MLVYFSARRASLFGDEPGRSWALVLRAGLTAPTGRYEPELGVSSSKVDGAADGSIELLTYNTQASLGAGVWSLLGALELGWQAHGRLDVMITAGLRQPMSSTPDGIRWGYDLSAGLESHVELIAERLFVTAGVDYRRHGPDDLSGQVEDTADPESARAGGRHEIGVGLGAWVQLGSGLGCGLRAHLPVWQRVEGIQLVETLGVMTSCRLDLGI